jgi:hypothetical protein
MHTYHNKAYHFERDAGNLGSNSGVFVLRKAASDRWAVARPCLRVTSCNPCR